MDIKILTDTAADLTPCEIENLGVTVIEMPVIVSGESEPTRDLNEFYTKLALGKTAKTSQPSPEDFREQFQAAKDGGYAVILILISDKLSATYESACFIKKQVGYEHIYIVNSFYATFAEKLMVYQAVKLKKQGLSAREIVEGLTEFRKKVTLCATPETLKYLALGGRISKTTAMIGNIIKLKPLFQCDDEGHIVVGTKVLGLERAILKMVEKFSSDKYDEDYPLFVFYSHDDKNARKLVDKLSAKGYKIDEKYFMPVGPTIGTHFGIGAFGLAYVRK